jgi:primosomal protein N' (replication factor Y)
MTPSQGQRALRGSHPCYVEVAVSLLAKPFHYQIPISLETTPLQLGTRLIVPFGSQVKIGYFIRYVDQPDTPRTKEILAVLDHPSPIPSHLAKLIEWITDYYFSHLGAVLASAFPKTNQYKIRRRLALTDEGRAAIASQKIKSETAQQIMTGLIKGEILFETLSAKVGTKNLMAALTPLRKKDWVQQRWDFAASTERSEKPIGEKEVIPHDSPSQGTLPPQGTLPHRLNADQQIAFDEIAAAICKGLFAPFLLQGVTGSGKTEVYLRAVETVLGKNKGAIVLVPEIGLTPQLFSRFQNRFGNQVAMLHSGLSPAERYEQWRRIKEKEAKIVIGARSALFAPMESVGLIIVDEEHDHSYKQEETIRFHARDIALVYAKLHNATIVLGSATPSLESFYNGKIGKLRVLSLPSRVSGRTMPQIRMIDLRERSLWALPFITKPLVAAIEKRLAVGEQTILFINRRGHTPALLCGDCGQKWQCKNCSVSLTFHKNEKKLLCHYCGFQQSAPSVCSNANCQGMRLIYMGAGTEQVEEGIKTIFPLARVLRMDRDTTSKKGAHSRIVSAMEEKEADILIGTQMVAKGHDFPMVTLVGIICADLSFSLPDFRASERTFQLLSQVIGRSGRGETPGEVFIQTFQPEHEAFRFLGDYGAFYQTEQGFREGAGYPPFTRLILLMLSHHEEKETEEKANQLAGILKRLGSRLPPAHAVTILGPAPAHFARLRKEYRYQILLKGKDHLRLRGMLKKGLEEFNRTDSKRVRLTIDVDPQSVM